MKITDRQAAARMKIMRDLHALGVGMKREQIRAKHPRLGKAARERMLAEWLAEGVRPMDPAKFVRRTGPR